MKKIVTIGGGTGHFVVLRGLKKYDIDISAIVSMADDGGSTGILRDELGVLPPGDVRQCLVALSGSGRLMRNLMNYRFENGGLGGHSFGNLLLSALEKVTGNFEKAVEEAGKILSIKGRVIPVTTHHVRLKMLLKSGTLLEGESVIFKSTELDQGYSRIYLEPAAVADPHALREMYDADVIVLGPGGLYTSVIPNLLVEGVSNALRETKAVKIFVANLMNKNGQTTSFKASDYLREVVKYVGEDCFDFILVNGKRPNEELLQRYASEGSLIENDLTGERVIVADLLDDREVEVSGKDPLLKHRSFIRHDSHKLAGELMKIVNSL